MKILLVKMSSLGDLIHTLPAITDACKNIPNIQFDWVVEENFVEIPAWHPGINRIIPIAFRRWRKQGFRFLFNEEFKSFKNQLRATHYDLIIDAQGLLKSVWITLLAHGIRCGLNRQSAWEPLASLAYQRRFHVKKNLEATCRVRQLFSQSLGYSFNPLEIDYGFRDELLQHAPPPQQYILFLHGTTSDIKKWPQSYWSTLAQLITSQGIAVKLPWGNEKEKQAAKTIAKSSPDLISILPSLTLNEMAKVILNASAIITLDTGLGHLSMAFKKPTIALYSITDPERVGRWGASQVCLHSKIKCSERCSHRRCDLAKKGSLAPACFVELTPAIVFNQLKQLLS